MWTLFTGQQYLPEVYHSKKKILFFIVLQGLQISFLENWYSQIISHRQKLLLTSALSLCYHWKPLCKWFCAKKCFADIAVLVLPQASGHSREDTSFCNTEITF